MLGYTPVDIIKIEGVERRKKQECLINFEKSINFVI